MNHEDEEAHETTKHLIAEKQRLEIRLETAKEIIAKLHSDVEELIVHRDVLVDEKTKGVWGMVAGKALQERDLLRYENERLRRELDEAKETLSGRTETLIAVRKANEDLQERIAKLEAELKEAKGEALTANDLKGEDKASYESANPEICFEDFYDTDK